MRVSAERYREIRRVFDTALDLAPAARAQYVRDETKGDDGLAAEVLLLLQADADDGGLPPIVAAPGAILAERDLTGSMLGPFRVLRRLGEGGMGTVYEAAQERPQRRVAIKTLASAFASERALRRFEDEIDILAQLRHPAIAQVLEVGTARIGGRQVPWFAMELVEESRPIDRYVREQRLDIAAILPLFQQVAAAVMFAHQRGVLHRDLKPANILVDGQGQPKVIDFGIARLTGAADDSMHRTRTGEILGTLAYLSPQRLEHGAAGDGIGADVYSLGVLLYELLTGRPPFPLDGLAPAKAVDVLRHYEPPAPSALVAGVAGELDWITQKAMARVVEERYSSVGELLGDLERHQRFEPLLAGPASAAYRLRKLMRRHRLTIGVAATIFIALAVGLIVATVGWRRVAGAEQVARREVRTLAEVNRFQERILRGAYSQERGRDVRIADVIDAAVADLEQRPFDDARVEVGLRTSVGISYLGLGLLAEAERNFRTAGAIADAHGVPASDPASSDLRNNLGLCLEEQGKLDQALPELQAALAARLAAANADGESPDSDERIAIARSNLASLLLKLTRGAEALPLAEAALSTFEHLLGAHDVATITARNAVAMCLAAVGRGDEADAAFRAALAAANEHLPPDHPARLSVVNEHGSHQRARGNFAGYSAAMQEIAAARERVLGPSHPRTLVALNNVAVSHLDRVDFVAAEQTLRRILAAREAAGVDSGFDYVGTGQNLTAVLRRQGRREDALANAARMRELAERSCPEGNWLIGVVNKEHGACLRDLGQFADAEPLLLRGAQILEAAVGAGDQRTQKVFAELVLLYEQWQKPDELAKWRKRHVQ